MTKKKTTRKTKRIRKTSPRSTFSVIGTGATGYKCLRCGKAINIKHPHVAAHAIMYLTESRSFNLDVMFCGPCINTMLGVIFQSLLIERWEMPDEVKKGLGLK